MWTICWLIDQFSAYAEVDSKNRTRKIGVQKTVPLCTRCLPSSFPCTALSLSTPFWHALTPLCSASLFTMWAHCSIWFQLSGFSGVNEGKLTLLSFPKETSTAQNLGPKRLQVQRSGQSLNFLCGTTTAIAKKPTKQKKPHSKSIDLSTHPSNMSTRKIMSHSRPKTGRLILQDMLAAAELMRSIKVLVWRCFSLV